MMRWNELMVYMRDHNRLIKGVRVVEVHPGTNLHKLSHGLHFHMLVNQRIPIHWLKRKAGKLDFGIIDVDGPVQIEQALYLGKYLTKDQPMLAKGSRRWGSINWPECNQVRDCKIESEFHRNIAEVQYHAKLNQLTPDTIHSIFVNTRLHGKFKDWPVERFYYGQNAKQFFDEFGNEYVPPGKTPSQLGMFPHRNKLTREQSMQNVAAYWKKKVEWIAKRRGIAPQEKKFFGTPGNPRVDTGETPVKKRDYVLDTSGYNWDKLRAKSLGTGPAINEA